MKSGFQSHGIRRMGGLAEMSVQIQSLQEAAGSHRPNCKFKAYSCKGFGLQKLGLATATVHLKRRVEKCFKSAMFSNPDYLWLSH